MAADTNKPLARNFWKWFDPRGREIGTWAYILNRITALGLTLYLFIHLIVLSQLAKPEAYGNFLELTQSWYFKLFELLVLIAGIYHGLNGLRIGLTSFGVGVGRQKPLFWGILILTGLGAFVFFVRMFFI
jgi:succinate dehydrogenase / fumarate reductase, cytochrome b subunit